MTRRRYFGIGQASRLASLLDTLGVQRVFLVTGRSSFQASGAATTLAPALAGRYTYRHFDFRENPSFEDVLTGVLALKAHAADVVVAIGGGTAIDTAKLINALAFQEAAALDIITGHAPVARRGLPLICLPTTSGSGSEATHFAVVYVGSKKFSVAHPSLLPDFVLIDPALTFSLPPRLTAITAMDALAQAVESYWSIHSTQRSKRYAAAAIRLALKHVAAAVHAPSPTSRAAMSLAAHLAGMAINISKTTAAHALSYALTSHFGIPHGHAVSLTLGQLFLYNTQLDDSDVADPRGRSYVLGTLAELATLLGCSSATECRDRIDAAMRSLGLETRLSELGISPAEALQVLENNVNMERLANNPRRLDRDAIRGIVRAIG